MNCVSRCSESDAPLCSLGEFLENLRALKWEVADIEKIEQAALQLLGKLGKRNADELERFGGTMT